MKRFQLAVQGWPVSTWKVLLGTNRYKVYNIPCLNGQLLSNTLSWTVINWRLYISMYTGYKVITYYADGEMKYDFLWSFCQMNFKCWKHLYFRPLSSLSLWLHPLLLQIQCPSHLRMVSHLQITQWESWTIMIEAKRQKCCEILARRVGVYVAYLWFWSRPKWLRSHV